MFTKIEFKNKEEAYKDLIKKAPFIFEGCEAITNYANSSAFINAYLKDIEWVGFYIAFKDKLILGPFQGNPACVEISYGKGVVGTCAQKKELINVPDVSKIDNYISCSSLTKSEICIPVIKDGILLGVLDIDSPNINRFDETDEMNLSVFVEILVHYL